MESPKFCKTESPESDSLMMEASDVCKTKPKDFSKMEAHDFSETKSPEPDFLKMKASDVCKMEAQDFPKMEAQMKSPELDFLKGEARDVCKIEPQDFPKMAVNFPPPALPKMKALDFPKTEPDDFPEMKQPDDLSLASDYLKLGKQGFCKKEKSMCASSPLTSKNEEGISLGSKQKISCKSGKDERIRNFIRLLLSYPVRIAEEGRPLEVSTDWLYGISDDCFSLLPRDKKPLRYVEGFVPKEIIREVEEGERSIAIFNDDIDIPEAIINLSIDLAVNQLIQTLLSKLPHGPIPKYIRFSTRSGVEKKAVMQKIAAALEDTHNKLEIRNAFHKILMIDASSYESPVEHHVRQHVYQLLNTANATEDSDIFLRKGIEEEMSSNKYLVLLVDRDDEKKLDPRKLGFFKTELSGVMVLITTECSTQQDKDDLIIEMDLEIRTKDHLLPWQVFCHNVGSEVLCLSSAIQSIAVHIVEECCGHLLAIVLLADWLKNKQDAKLWELALRKMRYTDPSYGIRKFHSLSRVMINTFLNIIWDGMNETQKHCLFRCLFIPKIKDGKADYELTNDWVSSLLMDAEEAEHNLRELVDRSILLQFEGIAGWYFRLPQETYEILESLYLSSPLVIGKSKLALTELPDIELWHRAVRIALADKELSELPPDPNWSKVKVLMLQGNANLTKIPSSFFVHMPLLQILDLSYSSIRELPSSFFSLEQLRELYMKGCERFMKLPPEIGRLHKLEKLDLDETQIIHLPKEIQELTNLQSLTLYFFEFRGKKNKSYSCSTIIPSGVISKLKGLKQLNIDVNPDDERWHENVQVILPEIFKLKSLQTVSLYVPKLELLKRIPAHILKIDFRFIVGCHMQRILSGIPPAVDVKFKESNCSLKFVKGVDVPSAIKKLLRHSKALFLDRHMTMKNLSEFGVKNLNQLRVCILAECKEMQTIVDGRHSNGNNGMLSRLLFLSVSHMKNLRSIWEGPTTSRCGIFHMLQSLSLQNCPQLTTLFSLNFVGNLSLLKELVVIDCPKLRTLISRSGCFSLLTTGYLSKLRKLSLLHLPELISISEGFYVGATLEEIGFYDCPKLKSLSAKEVSSPKLRVIKGEANWWNSLEWSDRFGKKASPPSGLFFPINEEADVMTQLGIHNNDNSGEPVGQPSHPTGSSSSKVQN